MESTQLKYVAYYRASTEKQRDGLGLEVQKKSVHEFISRFKGELIDEISEIVSGGALVREGFDHALNLCKLHDAILVVHRVDRLSRGGLMTIAKMEEDGIPFVEADAPFDTQFSKNIKFLVAKEEKEKIQRRVKDSLAEIKNQIAETGSYTTKAGKVITTLGSPENLSDKARKRSAQVRKAQAISNENNRKAFAVVDRMRQDSTLAQMATYLNKHGFKTSRGGKWYAASVSNLIKLYE